MSLSEAVRVIERFAHDVHATEAAVKVRRPDYWERKSYTGSGDWMQVSSHEGAVDLGLHSASLTLHGPVYAYLVDGRLELSGYTRALWQRDQGSASPPETFHDGTFVLLPAAAKPFGPPRNDVAFRAFLGVLAALVLVGLVVMPFGLLSAAEDAERRTGSATGRITHAESAYTGKGGSGWVCAYEFTVGGLEFVGKDQCPRSVGVGDPTPVLYEPGDPANSRAWWTAKSEQRNALWGFGVWAFLLGSTIWGGWTYTRTRRKPRM